MHPTSAFSILLIASCFARSAATNGSYAFFRSMPERRMYGGELADTARCPFVVALLDRYHEQSCTATAISSHWCITAAHCFIGKGTGHYVRFNSRNAFRGGHLTLVHHSYQHPEFLVVESNRNGKVNVTKLQNDIGLVSTVDPMTIVSAEPFPIMGELSPEILAGGKVRIYGFGNSDTEKDHPLMTVELAMTTCGNTDWRICACGWPIEGEESKGPCEGDSGGPVFYNGTLVAVTSMGPADCSVTIPTYESHTVFTLLRPYLPIIEVTVAGGSRDTPAMRMVDSQAVLCTSSHLVLITTLILFI